MDWFERLPDDLRGRRSEIFSVGVQDNHELFISEARGRHTIGTWVKRPDGKKANLVGIAPTFHKLALNELAVLIRLGFPYPREIGSPNAWFNADMFDKIIRAEDETGIDLKDWGLLTTVLKIMEAGLSATERDF